MLDFLDQLMAVSEVNYGNDSVKATNLHHKMQMSRSALHYKLKKHLGQSTAEFLANFRIKRAKQLLTGSDQSIKMIALQVGFKDPNYFCRVFKNDSGLPPSEYRKMNRKL